MGIYFHYPNFFLLSICMHCMVNLLSRLILSIFWLLRNYLKVSLRLKRIKLKVMLTIIYGINYISLKSMQIILCVNLFLEVSLSPFLHIVIHSSEEVTFVSNAIHTRFLNVVSFGPICIRMPACLSKLVINAKE